MACGIYKITNLVNGKCYIGQSKNIEARWKGHKREYLKHDYPIYLAMRKYGVDNFKFEVIIECDKDDLNFYETEYIYYFRSYIHMENSNGYNCTLGGAGLVGYVPSVHDIEKAHLRYMIAIQNKDALIKYRDLKKMLKNSPYSSEIKIGIDYDCMEIFLADKKNKYMVRCLSFDEVKDTDIQTLLDDVHAEIEGNETIDYLCDYWVECGLYSCYEEFFD